MIRQSPDRRKTPAKLSLIPGTSVHVRPQNPMTPHRELVSLSVISGKGGVGKSTFIANLAVLFARRGLNVLVLDGDLSLANVDLLLGLVPKYNLWDVVSGKMTLDDILLEGPHGIKLLPAASGVEDMANLDDYRREVLIRSLDDLKKRHDVFLVDTGSGIQRQNIRLAQATREILILTTPEPTAFSDAYATLKVLLGRPIWNAPRLVLNRVRNGSEGRRATRRIRSVAQHFLQMKPEVLGTIPEDDLVLRSIHAQEPFVDMFPKSRAAAALERMADQLLLVEEPPRTRLPGHISAA